MLLLIKKADACLKQNMSCWSVNSFDFFPRKIERINGPTKHAFLHNCWAATYQQECNTIFIHWWGFCSYLFDRYAMIIVMVIWNLLYVLNCSLYKVWPTLKWWQFTQTFPIMFPKQIYNKQTFVVGRCEQFLQLKKLQVYFTPNQLSSRICITSDQ